MQHFKALHTENVLVSFLKSHKLKILIVKLSSLGDVVHTLPAVMDIKEHVPNAQIDWVVERGFAPLLKLAPFVQNITYAKYRDLQKSSVHIATDFDCFYKLGFIIGNHRLLYYLISCSITPCVCFIINRQTWPSCCTQCLV